MPAAAFTVAGRLNHTCKSSYFEKHHKLEVHFGARPACRVLCTTGGTNLVSATKRIRSTKLHAGGGAEEVHP